MPFSSAGLLQFDELKELVARYAGSGAGRALVLSLDQHWNRVAIENGLANAGEAIQYLREVSGAVETGRGAAVLLRFDQVRDVDAAVRVLQVEGASLDGREILDLFHTFAIAGEYRGIFLS